MRPLRRHLTFANVMSCIAVFVALATGGAYAANTVFSTDIVDGEVKSADIEDFTIKARDIEEGAVNSGRVADEALRDHDLDTGSVGTSEIADGAVAPGDLDQSTVDDLDTGTFETEALGCDPVTGPLAPCGPDPLVVTLDAPSDLVVHAEGVWFGPGPDGESGECRIESDEFGGLIHPYGQTGNQHISRGRGASMSQTAAFDSLSPGTYEIWFECHEVEEDFVVDFVRLTALRLGGDEREPRPLGAR